MASSRGDLLFMPQQNVTVGLSSQSWGCWGLHKVKSSRIDVTVDTKM